MALINWPLGLPTKQRKQFIIRREVPSIKKKKGEGGPVGRGQGKVAGGQPHSG